MAEADNPTSHTYFSQRLRLHYLDWGNDGAPTLLLIHGMRDHCRTWDAVAERLRDRFHVIALDLRGHGDSAWPTGSTYSHIDYVYDIAQLIHQARLAPVTIVAHSMGGTLACLYAGIYPETVSRMVIVEGVGHWWKFFARPPVHERLAGWIDGMRTLSSRQSKRYPTLEDAYQRMQKTNPHLSPELALHLTSHGSHRNEDGTYSWKFDNYTHAHSPYDVTSEDTEALWQRIHCPVLFVNSAQGYPHRIGQDDTLTHFRGGRVVSIEGAGHWTHHDQPSAFMAVVEPFLAH
ncbi:MAG: alpha/beta hydrolase [Gammaproteobacteria bacterium]|nr:alpha/beta hydrolase [Gammaproteobacteria bacterium]